MSELIETNSRLTTIQPRRDVMDVAPMPMPAKPMSVKARVKLGLSAVALFAVAYLMAVVFLGW